MPPIDPAEALRLLEQEAQPLGTIRVPRGASPGLVLAEVIRADRDFPPTARSAMDGFAVRAADVQQSGNVLKVVGQVRAGQPLGDLRVGAFEAARIMTGGVVPPGADAVVMVEFAEDRPAEGAVRVLGRAEPGQHVRQVGEEIQAGAVVLEPGVLIHAAEIAALCSVGCASVEVFRRPTVSVLATGDEVVEPDRPVLDHQVRNSNAHALMAQLGEMGLAARDLGIAGDECSDLERRLKSGLEGDVLLITGGVSVGDYDLVASTLAALGMRLLFHRVAVKPGQPLLAGRCGRCLVVGLPGNPVSTFTMFAVFVAPALRRMIGHRNWRNVELSAVLEESLNAAPGRSTYHLARLTAGPDGLLARRVRAAGSGDVLALARANGFIVTGPEGAKLPAGDTVHVLAWRDFHLR